MIEEEFWFGEDIKGNSYCICTDKSPKDFWIETVVQKDSKGHYYVWSCNIIIPEKDDINDTES